MKAFAIIIDETTKKCAVGLETDAEAYKKMGMSELEVEQGYDGSWYLAGHAPAGPTEEEKRQWRIGEIKAELNGLDTKSARPLRAVLAGTATDEDRARLTELETEAQKLREEMAGLEAGLAGLEGEAG